jgi:hypothetical protein
LLKELNRDLQDDSNELWYEVERLKGLLKIKHLESEVESLTELLGLNNLEIEVEKLKRRVKDLENEKKESAEAIRRTG